MDAVEAQVDDCVTHLPASSGKTDEYRKAQTTDYVCSSIMRYCRQSWPEKRDIENMFIPYWKARGELTLGKNNLLLYNDRIVVPKYLHGQTHEKLHMRHQGVQRCRLRAKISVWWSGISHQVENIVKQCPICACTHIPRKEPMIPSELPDFPWQKVGTDLFHFQGSSYLVVVDYFSRYPEIQKLSSTNSHSIIVALKNVFSRFGIPEVVVSDNGPQFVSTQFHHFAQSYEFHHVTSSPLFAQGNGQVECTVKTMKKLLRSPNPLMALLINHSTPFPWCNLSPAELLMGRQLRTNFPIQSNQLKPKWDYLDEFRRKNLAFKNQQKQNFDVRHGVQNHPPLPNDTSVWVTSDHQTIPGRVVSTATILRSYVVETPTG